MENSQVESKGSGLLGTVDFRDFADLASNALPRRARWPKAGLGRVRKLA